MSSSQETLVFFGATGGCAVVTLAQSLKANYSCTALVRTPSKLRNLLEGQHGLPAALLDQYLTITEGNVLDEAAVKTALMTQGHLPDKILFAVGGTPKLQMSLNPVAIDQPDLCSHGMAALLSALKALQQSNAPLAASGKRPVVSCISTTGISDTRDVPYSIYPIYHAMLAVPHKDKRGMEKELVDAAHEDGSPLGGFTIVRPTLLTDGKAKGPAAVRAGWVWPDGRQGTEKAPGPQKGYTISRADVGTWIFDNVIKSGDKYINKCASLST